MISHFKELGESRVNKIHDVAKVVWNETLKSPSELINKCMSAWDEISENIGVKINPLIPVEDDRQVTNLIFGSGGFSTGRFQALQYQRVKETIDNPPVRLLGLVANKSREHGCGARLISEELNVPVIELDFNDWYHENVEPEENNPIRASRYWFMKDDSSRPSDEVLKKRFKIRQELFHGALGDLIADTLSGPVDIVSARGYNFQFCQSIFRFQDFMPHVNDTHPADLTYVNPETGEKLYPGWQAGAVQKMIDDGHSLIRGSLIEVGMMDHFSQINELDEGALLSIGKGVDRKQHDFQDAKQIQDAMKLVDDQVFCTLEPTGLLLAWGVTEKPIDVVFQDIQGNEIIIKQKGIVVGDKVRGGINSWGVNLEKDLEDLKRFLLKN
ncbi:MAG: hypothetical protein ACTSVI_01665 [Promethearchaeota archaeon]